MKKLLVILFAASVGCSGDKTTETTIPASDTLMDSTTIQMKADTTVKRLDNLEDSIEKLREKAADQN